MNSTDRSYYSARLAQEESLARAARCDASRLAHQRLADTYRSMITRPIAIAA